jgi:magnesium chelatase subunit H
MFALEVAIVLYGYPPGIGATGTAALLNVPRSLYRSQKKGGLPW